MGNGGVEGELKHNFSSEASVGSEEEPHSNCPKDDAKAAEGHAGNPDADSGLREEEARGAGGANGGLPVAVAAATEEDVQPELDAALCEEESDESYLPPEEWEGIESGDEANAAGGSSGGDPRSRSRSRDGDNTARPPSDDDIFGADELQVQAFAAIERGEPCDLQALLVGSPALLRSTDVIGRTLLHAALMKGRADMVATVLTMAADCGRGTMDQVLGTPFMGDSSGQKDSLPALHLSLSLAPFEATESAALQCLKLLLAQGKLPVDDADNLGRTALHVACVQGSHGVLDTLLEHRADPGVCDDLGNLPLHYAIDSQNRRCVEIMLRASDPALFSRDLHPFYRCIDRQAWEAAFMIYTRGWPIPEADINRIFDFAASRGLAAEWNFVTENGVKNCSTLDELQWPSDVSSSVSTAIVTHSVCAEHGALPHDIDDLSFRQYLITKVPENPHRLEVLCGKHGILRSDGFKELRWASEPPPAPLVDVLRVHEYWYVHKLAERVKEVQSMTRRDPFKKLPLDKGDTRVTAESWRAALRACGCVIEAVDIICNEQSRNAFCAVRPPGHHLGPAGACNNQDLEDDPEGSQGFCLLNNVAIGAAYARCVYRHMIRKVAIVDFDVHHGNGTEAVVRNIKERQSKKRAMMSLDAGAGVSFKVLAETPPACKPWMDPESDVDNIFFASIHGYGGGFYPGTGASCHEAAPRVVNVALRPGSTSVDFRDGLRRQILPELLAFDPDIVFVSAGFDGHEDDLIGNCLCVDEDYVWVTQQLVSIANRCCQGRLVSVLEGGYNTRALGLSPFAQSVARHVRTLMHTCPNYCFLEWEHSADVFQELDSQRHRRRVEARYARTRRLRVKESPATPSCGSMAPAAFAGQEAKEPAQKKMRLMKAAALSAQAAAVAAPRSSSATALPQPLSYEMPPDDAAVDCQPGDGGTMNGQDGGEEEAKMTLQSAEIKNATGNDIRPSAEPSPRNVEVPFKRTEIADA